MGDPLVDAHCLIPGLYVLGWPLTPISIRDQMLRARWLIDRLFDDQKLKIGDTLLVVGAGIAGATGAIRAAQRGVNALLIEQSGGAFGLQARSNTRWIDPVQYDWPAGHWDQSRYPLQPPPMPLGFNAGYSRNLATYWDVLLHRHIRLNRPRLNYQRNVRARAILPGTRAALLVSLQTPIGLGNLHADLVIWAVGFGDEKTSIQRKTGGTLSSAPFWSSDKLQDPRCGIVNIPSRVLILGSGDGALQDFLRVATAERSAREIWNKLGMPSQISTEAQDIEAQFHRALTWCNGGGDEARLHESRDKFYRDFVDQLWLSPGFPARAASVLRTDIDSLIMAFPTTYLTAFYGLNCILARIIGRAWADVHGFSIDEVLRCGWKARDGDFTGSPPLYTVTLDAQAGCPLSVPTPDSQDCELLIIRIGIDPRSAAVPFKSPAMLRTRHLFPYHLPG